MRAASLSALAARNTTLLCIVPPPKGCGCRISATPRTRSTRGSFMIASSCPCSTGTSRLPAGYMSQEVSSTRESADAERDLGGQFTRLCAGETVRLATIRLRCQLQILLRCLPRKTEIRVLSRGWNRLPELKLGRRSQTRGGWRPWMDAFSPLFRLSLRLSWHSSSPHYLLACWQRTFWLSPCRRVCENLLMSC